MKNQKYYVKMQPNIFNLFKFQIINTNCLAQKPLNINNYKIKFLDKKIYINQAVITPHMTLKKILINKKVIKFTSIILQNIKKKITRKQNMKR